MNVHVKYRGRRAGAPEDKKIARSMNYMSHYVDDIIGQDENEDLSVRFDLLFVNFNRQLYQTVYVMWFTFELLDVFSTDLQHTSNIGKYIN
jgi:hypothetical protein